MEPLFTALFQLPIIHVHERGGVTRWADVSECVFDCLHHEDPATRSVVISTLVDAGATVAVAVHQHLLLALGAYGRHTPETIIPALVRSHLSHSPATYEHQPRQSKLHLLSFILKDEDFGNLGGICLLPLLDGSFTQFTRKSTERVYLTTSEFTAELLPGLHSLLVGTMDMDERLQGKMTKLAKSGKHRVCFTHFCIGAASLIYWSSSEPADKCLMAVYAWQLFIFVYIMPSSEIII